MVKLGITTKLGSFFAKLFVVFPFSSTAIYLPFSLMGQAHVALQCCLLENIRSFIGNAPQLGLAFEFGPNDLA